ncbi:hypothetical protein SAMN04487897_10962 [Paenibacillus sp. yr247]|nr:hypothetical protein SAMN04487897_10962 [Paenibacillus sp. yr247]
MAMICLDQNHMFGKVKSFPVDTGTPLLDARYVQPRCVQLPKTAKLCATNFRIFAIDDHSLILEDSEV